MKVPFITLSEQHAAIREELLESVRGVLESQLFINGPAVRELERRLADLCECKAAVGVSSGTDALLCSLMALGIGPGDEVITTPFTFLATAGSIWRLGARPVFVDIEADTFNIAPALIEGAVTRRTRAILPVHLFGQMAELAPILQVAHKHHLYVIEDAAQALGALQGGRKAGSLGHVGCFSFYPTKNLGGLGDGGMIVTRDPELAEKFAAFRQHGSLSKNRHQWVAANFRLDTLQAAALLVKLGHLERWTAQRRANARRYDELFSASDAVETPAVHAHNHSIFNQYVIRVPKRDELREFLAQKGIGSGVYYTPSLHLERCFADLGYKRGDFPQSEKAADEALALPIYPELTEDEIVYVADQVRGFFA